MVEEARAQRLQDMRERLSEAPRFAVNQRRNQFEATQLRLILASVLTADSSGVDIGAHGGDVLREYRRLAPAGHHVAFEPIPALAQRLRDLYPDSTVHEMALGAESGETSFTYVASLSPRSGFRRQKYPPGVAESDVQEIRVEVRQLDEMLSSTFVPAVVKVDVEGAEELVLLGAERTLARTRPAIVVECDERAYATYGSTSESRFNRFMEWGYRVFDFAGDGPYSREQFVHAQGERLWVNFFLQPATRGQLPV